MDRSIYTALNSMSILIAMPCYGGMVSDKTAKGLFNLGKNLRSA